MSFFKSLFGGKPSFTAPDLSGLSLEEKERTLTKYAQDAKIPRFEGTALSYGYSKSYAIDVDDCPRCKKNLHRKYTEIIYATDGKPRVAYMPAAYFCNDCPTVIIDEKAVKKGVTDEVEFQGSIGVDTERKPLLFKSWNDKATHYVMDKVAKRPIRMKTLNAGETVEEEAKKTGKIASPTVVKVTRKRKKTAKKSRQANRRKK